MTKKHVQKFSTYLGNKEMLNKMTPRVLFTPFWMAKFRNRDIQLPDALYVFPVSSHTQSLNRGV